MVTSRKASAGAYEAMTAMFRNGIAGDAASYRGFLTPVTPMLRRVAQRKLSVQDAEDVVQEILLSIHKARHTYDGQRPLVPWLLAIAQYRIHDALRKHYAGSRRESVNIDDLAEMLPDVTEAPEKGEFVNEALQHVAERERKILTMMHMEGYTAKETGDRLGMKESAVKVAAHRAIRKIREAIGSGHQ